MQLHLGAYRGLERCELQHFEQVMCRNFWIVPDSGERLMRKKCVVRLSDEEHRICDETVDKPKGGSQRARRARILRQRDVDGSSWSVRQVAETYRSRVRTDENVRRRCVLEGF